MEVFIGRKREKEILKKAFASPKAELVAVIGRRRVGKTFLINHTYGDNIAFHITGVQNGTTERQLTNFSVRLNIFGKENVNNFGVPKDWFAAFTQLELYLTEELKSGRKVVFIDEVPWLATPKSEFIQALGYFWNNWAEKQNLVVAICGSAASWMVQNVVNDTGGLHNRITQYIELQPFTLKETKAFLQSRYIDLTNYQITELYMALGGIPHYLEKVERGKSAVQNIDSICFSPTGLLRNEFSRLYPALFKNAAYHLSIIRALATKRMGMTRSEILEKADVPQGGAVTTTLEELEQSGFILSYLPFGKKKKGTLYRLTDEYSLFYLYFIEDQSNAGAGTWNHLSQTQKYRTWSGYAFESICLKHLPQIKKALGITGIYSKTASFYRKRTENELGVQIDLLIDRMDNVISLLEVKFYNKEWTLSEANAKSLTEKKQRFQIVTKTNKQVSIVLMTTFGIKQNKHSLGLVDRVLELDDLFE